MQTNTVRKLATIERITSLSPIENADAIETAHVRGWEVVVKKGEFKVGDTVVYFEVDSFLPIADKRYAFLAPRGIRVQDEVQGHVLKTARLRGQYSQGLVLPLSQFPEIGVLDLLEHQDFEGADLTDELGIVKWDPPLPAELAGQAIGFFPDAAFSKSDEERAENLGAVFGVEGDWFATEKVDGTSISFWVDGEEDHVSSRNLDLKENPDHSAWKIARELNIFQKLRSEYGDRAMIQGELFGPGIQKNPLNVKEVQWAAFTIQANNREIPRADWPGWALDISVPVRELWYPENLDEAREQVEGLQTAYGTGKPIEGIVWRLHDRARLDDGKRASFKVLSRKYLLKNDR